MGMMSVLMQLRKVCNHPALFEPRPVTSPLYLPTLGYVAPKRADDGEDEEAVVWLRQRPPHRHAASPYAPSSSSSSPSSSSDSSRGGSSGSSGSSSSSTTGALYDAGAAAWTAGQAVDISWSWHSQPPAGVQVAQAQGVLSAAGCEALVQASCASGGRLTLEGVPGLAGWLDGRLAALAARVPAAAAGRAAHAELVRGHSRAYQHQGKGSSGPAARC